MEKKKEIHIGFSDTEPTMTFSCPPEGLPQKKKKKRMINCFLFHFTNLHPPFFCHRKTMGGLCCLSPKTSYHLGLGPLRESGKELLKLN